MTDPTTQGPLISTDQASDGLVLSLSEIDALSKKAARGAGYSWGMAEEAGKAVRWLAARGLPGPDCLADVLAEVAPAFADLTHVSEQDGLWRTDAGRMCPITTGAQLADRAHVLASASGYRLQGVARPLLLVPFLFRVAKRAAIGVHLDVAGKVVSVSADGVAEENLDGLADLSDANVEVVRAGNESDPALSPGYGGYPMRHDVWRRLDAFAQKTYVPESEQSRARGAG